MVCDKPVDDCVSDKVYALEGRVSAGYPEVEVERQMAVNGRWPVCGIGPQGNKDGTDESIWLDCGQGGPDAN